MKEGHANFCSLIHTMGTPQGCSSFIKDGSLPFTRSKVGYPLEITALQSSLFLICSFSIGNLERLVLMVIADAFSPFICLLEFSFGIPKMIFLCISMEGDGSGSFLLKNIYSGNATTERMRTAKYSVALQYIILEGITDGTEY